MDEKEMELLRILEKNGRLDTETIASMIEVKEEEVKKMIEKLEQECAILGYSTLINWAKVLTHQGVTAMIEVKVTPTRGVGFDHVAERIYRFPEVKALYLMSGAYDLSITVEGQTMMEISRFVSDKLSTLESVVSTTTHFVLKKYKHDGVIFQDKDDDDKRMMVTP
ncbi:DNA-binding Lrp family transcriptional regulator [Natronobacillus azotifigens]|uniref:Lrp/AsnC family transcriptional regulator n=1 Tax=Natronobacillus azotifigens TaxID=472978 RepID=A0A9J6RF37_9BACI|nr:Lrp/AsnC family transcriptional regulator [Natronobacillus azotifigens]MCZ0704370.1 Lrp/AsnC family transcriptional regulator [Natronobacillus azotifigens]